MNWGKQAEQFRAEVRAFLDERLTPELRDEASLQTGVFAEATLSQQWHRILHDKGWSTPMWPQEHGGAGWTALQKYIFEQECARVDAPVLSSAGIAMCGPILILFGTDEQKARFLPPLRAGEIYWCQGYSEPGAGSDLANLSCRARRDGDDYIVDGTKIWTTHAHFADWIFLLVRTSSEGRPQEGITFLLADMTSPGIEVRPIISMSGDHEVNQVFFDGVRVPASNRVGEENAGWTVAKRLLEFERSSFYGPRTRRVLGRIARRLAADGDLRRSADFRRRLAALSIEADVLEQSELNMIASSNSLVDGVTTSLLKIAGSEILQRASELAMAAGGMRSAYVTGGPQADDEVEDAAVLTARYLNTRAATIYGGSSEVQRNIIAKAVLRL